MTLGLRGGALIHLKLTGPSSPVHPCAKLYSTDAECTFPGASGLV